MLGIYDGGVIALFAEKEYSVWKTDKEATMQMLDLLYKIRDKKISIGADEYTLVETIDEIYKNVNIIIEKLEKLLK